MTIQRSGCRTCRSASAASTLPDKAAVAADAEKLLAETNPADGPGAALLVARGDEVIYRSARGQPAFDLYAESPSKFFLTVVDATLTFAPDSGAVTGVTLHQGPAVIEFERIE